MTEPLFRIGDRVSIIRGDYDPDDHHTVTAAADGQIIVRDAKGRRYRFPSFYLRKVGQ